MPPSSRFSAARTASRPSTAPVNTAALLELLDGRELRDISVSQIAAAAEVHRVSFYRSFAEKEDILREHINVTFREWESSRTPPAQDQAMPDLFAYMARNGGFYRLLYRRGLFHLFKAVLLSNIGPKPEYSNHIAYAAAFLANGIYGWIEEWIARGMQESPEEMAVLLQEKL